MALTIDLTPEVEDRLLVEASRRGVQVSDFVRDLIERSIATPETSERSLLELEGLGAEIWRGIDAQDYVNQLRSEWDHRL